MADYIIPSFLEDQGVDDIHIRMLNALPDDMDTSQGSHAWNLTRPAAAAIAEYIEYQLNEAIKVIFPMFSEGYAEIMDYHAETRGLQRKAATYATGAITVTAPEGTVIPYGSRFSTASENEEPSIDFATVETATVDASGEVDIPIQAETAGTAGNVIAGSIILNSSVVASITNVTNNEPTTGGIDEESTEALQKRIVQRDQSNDTSYGGTVSDYKRWAEAVTGVGYANVTAPTDDSGVITITITDTEGQPASTELCDDVYDHIMSPANPANRLAPINDQIEVAAPTSVTLAISATIQLAEGRTTSDAINALLEAVRAYATTAASEGVVKYSKIAGLMSDNASVADYKLLRLNNDTANIALTASQVPTIDSDSITLTIGPI